MKYKKYLTMFLAGTLVVSSSPANIFADSLGQQIEQQESTTDAGTTETGTTETGTTETGTTETGTTETGTTETGTTETGTTEAGATETGTTETGTTETGTAETGTTETGTTETGTTETGTAETGTTETDTAETGTTETGTGTTEGAENTEESENIEETTDTGEFAEEPPLLGASLLTASAVTVAAPEITTQDSYAVSQTHYANNVAVSVEITVPEGTTVYYTTDGTDPTESDTKQLYSDAFQVTASSTDAETIVVKAVSAQEVTEAETTITQYSELVTKEIGFIAVVDVTEPTITAYDSSGNTQESYSYLSAVTVEIDAPFNTEVFFTTDGSDPTRSSTKQLYEGTFSVVLPTAQYMTGGTTVVKAVVRTGIEGENGETIYVYSDVVDSEVAFRAAAMPTNPTLKATQQTSGTVTTTSSMTKTISNIANSETVVIGITHTNDVSSKILYTLDGTDPRISTTAIEYQGEFSVKASSLAAETVMIRATVEVMDGTQKLYTSPRKLNLEFLQETISAPELSVTALAEGETKYSNATEVTGTVINYDPNFTYVYTLDGTDPTLESRTYDSSTGITGIKAPSKAGGKVEIKVAAVKDGKYLSDITAKEIYFKVADGLTLTQGSYVADFVINCDDADYGYLKDSIDTKRVALNVDEDGKMSLTVRFCEKSITSAYPEGSYKFKAAKLVDHEGNETDLTFEEPSEMATYVYSTAMTYVIKTVTVPLDSLSSDVTLKFQNSNDTWANYVLTLISEPKLESDKTIDNSVMGYSISAGNNAVSYDGYRQSKALISINLNNQGYSATRPMLYYYTADDDEEISFASKNTTVPVVHSLQIATDYGQEGLSDSYLYTKSDGPHTLNVRVKGYVEGLGWTDEISISLKFNERALPSEIVDANGSEMVLTTTGTFADGTSSLAYMIPYDTVFKRDAITDETKISGYADLISQVNAEHGNSNMKVFKVTLETPEGEKIKVLDALGKFTQSFLRIPQSDGFSVETVSLYRISKDGTSAVLVPRSAGSNEMGYGMYIINNDYPDGVYVLVAGENADMPTMASGYHLATVKLKDSENKFKANEYANIIDRSYHQGYSVLDIKTYSKYLYLPLTDQDGEYVTDFYYYDYINSKYVKAAAEESYTVNGGKYVKLARIPITTKKAYLNVYFTTSTGKTQYGSLEMDYSSVVSTTGIYAQAPKMTTATGATTYVNNDKAVVSLSTASENAKIYYTCTSGATGVDPDTTKANQIYKDSFELSTESTAGETFTIRAVTVKSGFITSEIEEYKVTFNKEGMAAVTAGKPVIFAKYKSGTTAANGIYTVKLTNATEGAAVYYTTDGSEPSEQNGIMYTESFDVAALTNGSATVIKAIAVGISINTSEIAQTTISFSSDWWDNIEPGTSYAVPIKMLNFSNNSLLSMGNGALTGMSTLSVDADGNHYLTVPFQGINMGAGLSYLIDMWYFASEEATNENTWKANMIQGTYTYTVAGKIATVTIPLHDNSAKVSVGIESEFTAMGKQRATLSMDYSAVIEAVTGVAVETEKQVDTPIVDAVLNAAGNAMAVTISMPTASEVQDPDIYYILSGSDDAEVEKISGNKYTGKITITKEQAATFGGLENTVNVLAVAVKDGYIDSLVNVKKLSFVTSSTGGVPVDDGKIDVTQDGKYWVDIDLFKASDDELSMGNAAFENNSRALIITSGGESVIQIGSNPVKIDPYYSALEEFQFKNAGGTYQLATTLDTQEIKTTYNGKEYTFDYLKKFEFTLPSVTEEYIDVKVKVPYTIMDSAVGEGAISARLRINWSSLTVGKASDELKTNTSASESSASINSDAVDATDAKTGIRLVAPENVLAEGATLSVAEIKEGKQFVLAQKALGEDAPKFALYSILAKVNGEDTSPLGSLKLYIPIPEDFDEKRVILYRINDDGTKTLIHGSLKNGGLITLAKSAEPVYYEFETDKLGLFALVETDEVLNVPVLAEEVQEEEIFDDISGHWAKEHIKKAVEMGLFSGMSETNFGPNVKMTRGMFVTVLGKMDGIKANTYRGYKFSDVKDEEYFSSYVLWAAEMGIASGMKDGSFAPDQNITREQMAVMLAKYAEIKGVDLKNSGKSDFADSQSISDWAKEGVGTLAQAGVVSGRENGNFAPKDTASRADAATMLVRFIEEYMPSPVEAETETERI